VTSRPLLGSTSNVCTRALHRAPVRPAFRKPSELADYFVCTTWGVKGPNFYLLNVLRKKLVFPDLKRAISEQSDCFNPTVILIEDKASGTQLIQDLLDAGALRRTNHRQHGARNDGEGSGVRLETAAVAASSSPKRTLLLRITPMVYAGVVTPTWIGAARGLEGALTSGRGGGSPRPERFVS
jgi:hypothetical protein